MDWFIAVGVVVLVAILMVGLFHGPSRRHARPADVAPDVTAPADPGPPVAPEPAVATSSARGTTSVPGLAPDGSAAPDGPAVVEPDLAPVAYVLPPPRRRPHLGRRSTGRPGGRRA